MTLCTLKKRNILCYVFSVSVLVLLFCCSACDKKIDLPCEEYVCFASFENGRKSEYHLTLKSGGRCVIEIGIPHTSDAGDASEKCVFITSADAKYTVANNIIDVADVEVRGVKVTSENVDIGKMLKNEFDFPPEGNGDLDKLAKGNMISSEDAELYGIPTQKNIENATFCIIDDNTVSLKRVTTCENCLTVDGCIYDGVKILSQFRDGKIFLESAFYGQETIYTKDYYLSGTVKLVTYYKNGIISKTVCYDEDGKIADEPVYG